MKPKRKARGRYKQRATRKPDARPSAPPIHIAEWVEAYVAASPLKHQVARRTLAEALAACRSIVAAFLPTPPHELTDGQARALANAIKAADKLADRLGIVEDEEPAKQGDF